MTLFRYHYLTAEGRRRQGVVDASSLTEAKQQLRAQGLLVTKFLTRHRSRRESLRGQNLLTFILQLSQLIRAGLPIFESLTALEEQMRGERSHPILLALCEAIEGGASLSQAMSHHPTSFDSLTCAMVAAGESSGSLEETLDRLSQLLRRRLRLRKQLLTALLYPTVVAAFSFLVIFLLLTFAIPSIENLFEGRTLKPFTAIVLAISRLLSTYWWLYLPALALGGIGIGAYLRGAGGHRLALKLPVAVQAQLARFCHTLSTLLGGGLPMIDALQLARATIANPFLAEIIEKAEAGIVEGSSLSAELARSPLIPRLLPRMLRVGEESGSLPTMLDQVATLYEGEVEKQLTRLTTLAQPAILIILGAVVGTIMLAVLLPLTDASAFY